MNRLFTDRSKNPEKSIDKRVPSKTERDAKPTHPAPVPLRNIMRARLGDKNQKASLSKKDPVPSGQQTSRSVGRRPAKTATQPIKEDKTQVILNSLQKLDYDQANFQKLEQQFLQTIANDVKVSNLKLQSSSEAGKALLQNGQFLVLWCRLLKRNTFVNATLLFQKIQSEYESQLTKGMAEFAKFMSESKPKEPEEKRRGKRSTQKDPSASKNKQKDQKDETFSPRKLPTPQPERTRNTRSLSGNKKTLISFAEDSISPEIEIKKHKRETPAKPVELVIPVVVPQETRITVVETRIPPPPPIAPPADKPEPPKQKTFVERMRQAKAAAKSDKIQYPDLSDIKDVVTSKEKLKYSLLTTNDKFVVDFFEINDIMLLREIQIVAVLENDYKQLGLYCIVLVKSVADKDSQTAREFMAITTLVDTSKHNVPCLKEIEQKFHIEAFIVRQPGQDINKHWMSGIE